MLGREPGDGDKVFLGDVAGDAGDLEGVVVARFPATARRPIETVPAEHPSTWLLQLLALLGLQPVAEAV